MVIQFDKYEKWLINRLRLPEIVGWKSYEALIALLFNTPFRYVESISFDDNRVGDGLGFRDEFIYYNPDEQGFKFNDFCSVFEVIAGIAVRMVSEYVGDPGDEHPEIMMWELLDNLGLTFYTNKEYSSRVILTILNKWMDRKYASDGSGGLFPMKRTKRDQREVELWSQMNEYVGENFT